MVTEEVADEIKLSVLAKMRDLAKLRFQSLAKVRQDLVDGFIEKAIESYNPEGYENYPPHVLQNTISHLHTKVSLLRTELSSKEKQLDDLLSFFGVIISGPGKTGEDT